MHLRHSDHDHGPKTVKVIYHLEDPHSLTGGDEKKIELMASKGEHLLEVAVENGINIEHACGGVCACSTCHVSARSRAMGRSRCACRRGIGMR